MGVVCCRTLIIVIAWKKNFELSGESKHKLGGMRANKLYQNIVAGGRVRDTGHGIKKYHGGTGCAHTNRRMRDKFDFLFIFEV